ncbi:MAG: type II toxin-antitoxin system CcdA family antitoxin [Candidatus Dormibacteria bacterium]
MPRVNVYLPDDLASAIRPLHLNLSGVLQAALRRRLEDNRLDDWLGALEPEAHPRGRGDEADPGG